MDRIQLSEAIIHDLTATFADEVRALTIEVETDLETIERRLQALGRRALGALAQVLVQRQGEALERPQACARCGQPVHLVGARWRRHLCALVGDLTLERATYSCTGCGHGAVPLDTTLGLGPWEVTPTLARVVSWAGSMDAFAAASLHEMLGIALPVETGRVLA